MTTLNYLDYKILDPIVPESIYYIPDFITSHEEQILIDHVLRAPKPKWTYLSNRSLQVYGGYPKPEGMIPEPLPKWLEEYTNRLDRMGIFDGNHANQVLINRYEPGQGIMAHEDGPLYFPTVATLNTGSHTVLNLYEKMSSDDNNDTSNPPKQYRFSLLLWPRSLSMLKHDAYQNYLHEIQELTIDHINNSNSLKFVNLDRIPEIQERLQCSSSNIQLERQTRYSFTIRYVPKCHKLNLDKLFNFTKND